MSRFALQDDGSQHEHGAVINGAHLIERRQLTPLLELIVAALDDIASGIGRFVEGQWTPRLGSALRPLIAPLWDSVRNPPLAQQASATRITIAFVGDQPTRTGAEVSAPTRAGNLNALQERGQLHAVMLLGR